MLTGKPIGNKQQRGFGYLMALFAIAALGLLAATAGQVWHTAAQREREADLLFAGHAFAEALASYHAFAVNGQQQYPAALEDLLDDRRSQTTLRHLRRIYVDPMTGQTDWVLLTAGDRIVGLHSRSSDTTFRRNFDEKDAAFADTNRYEQWVFRAGMGTTP